MLVIVACSNVTDKLASGEDLPSEVLLYTKDNYEKRLGPSLGVLFHSLPVSVSRSYSC